MTDAALRRFELVEGTSSKFWEVERSGSQVTVRFGRIGTAGQAQTKAFDDEDKAEKERLKLVAEKTKKGYAEVGASNTPAPPPPPPKPAKAPPASSAPAAKAARVAPAIVAPPTALAGPASAQPSSEPEAEPASPAQPEAALASPTAGSSTPGSSAPELPHAEVSADEDVVHWTDRLRRRVHPRRGGVATPVPALPSLKKAWAAVQAAWKRREDALGLLVSKRLPGHEAIARLAARVAAPEASVGTVEDDAALIAALAYRPQYQVSPTPDEAIELLVVAGGLAHATRATLTSVERAVEQPEKSHANAPQLWSRGATQWGAGFEKHGVLDGLERLRALVAMAADEAYAEARDAAAELRGSATPAQRAAATFLFPTERAFVDADLPLLAAGQFSAIIGAVHDVAQLAGVSAAHQHLATAHYQAPTKDLAATLVDGVGVAGAPLLAAVELGPYANSEQRRDVFELLGALGHDAAVQALVGAVDQREAQAALAAAAMTQPKRVVRLGAAKAGERGKAGEPMRQILAGIARRSPALFDAVVATLPVDVQRPLHAIRRDAGGDVAEAPEAAVPALLRAPPWMSKTPRPAPPVVADLVVPAPDDAMVWGPNERERALAMKHPYRKDLSAAHWAKLLRGQERVDLISLGVAPVEIGRQLVGRVQRDYGWQDEWHGPIAARLEFDALPYFDQLLDVDVVPGLVAILPYGVARLAPRVATALAERKTAKAPARAWLTRHPQHAVSGLLGVALGPAGKARTSAEQALRWLAQNGHEATVVAVAKAAGAEAQVRAVLDFDPLSRFPARLPKRPEYADPRALPPILLQDSQGALPAAAVENVLAMLSFSTLDEPYAGLQTVRATCDGASLARFAWALFSAWLTHGGNSKEQWCMQALAWLGDDECAGKLAKLIREWPGEAAHARAVSGLDVLAGIGTDVALMHLNGIALKLKFKGLQAKAQEKIEQLAEARGLTREELEDRLAPDLGLDDDGSLGLDFGPRQFRVGFDEQLRPFVRDAAGARLKDLPKPNSKDDGPKAEAAAERWSALKKDAKTAATLQILRLELAMCGKRRFAARDFVELFVKHPLVFHVVRRLVWATYAEGALATTFRVAEDRTFADVEDGAWALPEDAIVGLPHPLEFPAEPLQRWSGVFADYELIQPFAQLGRDVYAPTDAERVATALERTKGLKVNTGKVLGLEQRRWRRGPPQDAGVTGWMEKPLPDGRTAILDLDPGLYTGMLSESPEQTLGATVVSEAGETGYWGHQRGVALGALDPVVFSELVRDLEGLRS